MRTVNEEWVQSTLEYLREYARENNGEVPVLSDIMKETGMVKSAAYRYLMILRDRGYIEYSGKGTLRLAGDNICFRKYGSVNVPIYGSVIFGSPEEAAALIDYTKEAILFAEAVGCPNLVFGSPKNRIIPEGKTRGDAVDFFRTIGDFFRRIIAWIQSIFKR